MVNKKWDLIMDINTKIEIVTNQAKLIIADYQKHGRVERETREDAIYCQGYLDIIIDIVKTNSLLPYKVEDIKFLWGQLQYILFDKED
jgi:hypothetical protein